MKPLNILYCCDNNYAPFCGTSIFSLLENNKDADEINIFVVNSNVSKDYINKIKDCVSQFGESRRLFLIDGEEAVKNIMNWDCPRIGTQQRPITDCFFNLYLPKTVERILYLDCDTIVVGNIQPLFELDINDSAIAAVPDCISNDYKIQLGFKNGEMYFNSGVLVIDINSWNKKGYDKRIQDLTFNTTFKTLYDQDYLNLISQNEAYPLPLIYNFQVPHVVFKDKIFFKVYENNIYSIKDVEEARKNVVIYHTYRFLGQFPWHKNRWHPSKKLFDYYLNKSPFSDYKKEPSNSFFFMVERLLYIVLPKKLFLKIFLHLQNKSFTKKLY